MDTRAKQVECGWVAEGPLPGVEKAVPGAAPSEMALAEINRFALEPLAADQVYVRTIRLCNDQYDRSGERLSAGYLERFAATMPGKSLLPGHNHRAMPLGKYFAAHVEDTGSAKHLVTSFYMRRSPENEALRADIDAGVVSHASIGFRWSDLICDLCNRSYYYTERDSEGNVSYCPHVIGRSYQGRECTATYGGDLAKVEAVEGSLVYLGCQYGSEIVKGLALGEAAEREALRARLREGRMEQGKGDLGARMADLEAQLAASTETERAAVARCGAVEAQLRELSEAAALVADGRLYRVDLAAEVKRLAGLVGADQEAALVLRACEQTNADAAALKALVAEYGQRFEKAFPPQGNGQPAQPAGERAASARAPRTHTVL